MCNFCAAVEESEWIGSRSWHPITPLPSLSRPSWRRRSHEKIVLSSIVPEITHSHTTHTIQTRPTVSSGNQQSSPPLFGGTKSRSSYFDRISWIGRYVTFRTWHVILPLFVNPSRTPITAAGQTRYRLDHGWRSQDRQVLTMESSSTSNSLPIGY